VQQVQHLGAEGRRVADDEVNHPQRRPPEWQNRHLPKPLVGDNGSGMHVRQSLAKGGVNLFSVSRIR